MTHALLSLECGAQLFSTRVVTSILSLSWQVAVHEIGHVLGLNHSDVGDSIMNAIYHRVIRGRFELSNHDRMEVKRSYG